MMVNIIAYKPTVHVCGQLYHVLCCDATRTCYPQHFDKQTDLILFIKSVDIVHRRYYVFLRGLTSTLLCVYMLPILSEHGLWLNGK